YMFDDFKYLADQHTVITYDLRNRGRSDTVTDASKLQRGIHNDVEDLEAVRAHFNTDLIDLIGHSYVGMVLALYAMKYPNRIGRMVQVGAVQPIVGKKYDAHLTGADATIAEIYAKMGELQKQGPAGDPIEFDRKMWSLMRQLYVANPADADKIHWSVADLPNESLSNVMRYYNESLLPSIQSLRLTAEEFAKVKMPVLVIHGTRDRQAPYGGAIDWASMLPNARLLTIEGAAHLPWIEEPKKVFDSIRAFLADE